MLLTVSIILVLVVYIVYEDVMKEARNKQHKLAILKVEHERDDLKRQVKSLQERLGRKS